MASPSETPTSSNSTPPQPHRNSPFSSSPQPLPNSTIVSSPLPLPSSPFSSSTSSSSDELEKFCYPALQICSDPPPSPTTEQIRQVQKIEMEISNIQADVNDLVNKIAGAYDNEEGDVILNAKLTKHLDQLEEKHKEAHQESEKKREELKSLETVTITNYGEFDVIFKFGSSSTKIWLHESTPERDIKCILMDCKKEKKEFGIERRVIAANAVSEEELIKEREALFEEKFPGWEHRSPYMFNNSTSSDE